MLININLLPAKKKKKVSFFVLLLLLALLVLATAGLFAAVHMKDKELEQTEQELSATVQLRETLEMSAAEQMSDSENSAKLLNDAIAWSENSQLPASPLLAHLTERLPDRGFFQIISYVREQTLIASIQFDTSREGAYYLSELKASPWIESVKISTVTAVAAETAETGQHAEKAEDVLPRYLVQYEIMFDETAVSTALEQEAKTNR